MAYQPGDTVEAFVGGAWKPGRICPGHAPQPGDLICVIFNDGSSDNFDPVDVRPAV